MGYFGVFFSGVLMGFILGIGICVIVVGSIERKARQSSKVVESYYLPKEKGEKREDN